MEIHCEDIENFTFEIKTEPRNHTKKQPLSKQIRIPLKGLNINNNELTPELKVSKEKSSLSEPVHNSKNRSRIISKKAAEVLEVTNNHKEEEVKLYKEEEIKLHKVKSEKLNATILAKILDHDTFIEDELGVNESDEQVLFKFLENEGRLSPEILKAFCKCTKITTVNMTRSYAGTKCESGLISEAKYSAKLCTKPFYYGFQQLLAIDFTNVKICDDELRYLIRLSKLQALGLSGTLVTDKGIKYLSVHSKFKSTLQCLKLCFLEGFSDISLNFLNEFTKLKNLDLRGNNNISLVGCLNLIGDTGKPDISIKLPENLNKQLSDLHIVYENLLKTNSSIILDPSDISLSQLSKSDIKSQLMIHKQAYNDIYLNQNMKYLESKLLEIVKRRKKEECLFRYSVKK